MKKTIILLFLFIGLGMSANAQQEIPKAITDQFQKMYVNAENVDWKEGDKGNFVADFKLEADKAKTVFSQDGTWIKTIIFIGEDKLPDAVMAAIKAAFTGGFSFMEVELIKSAEDDKYEAEIKLDGNSYKVLFDESGNILKKEEI